MQTELHRRTIREHGDALRNGEYSSRELSEYFLNRIAAAEKLNAFITITKEHAQPAATAADKKIKQGCKDPLTGIPLSHKDLFCTKDVLTSCASKMLSNFIAPYDAGVVEKLHSAGTVMLGKNNMDEFAMGSSNETSFYGAVKNPWDQRKVPGGSSGGGAAAVAARLIPFATATDTGGSIRQPAAFCGLTGIKPSYGRASRYGMVAFASSLDQAGVLATCAEDAALVLNAMCGFDARDSTSLKTEDQDFTANLNSNLKNKTIGLPKQFFSDLVDAEIAACVQTALQEFQKLGAKLVDVELPNITAAIPCYYVIAPAEAGSNLARFDGIRYGFRAEKFSDLNDLYASSRGEGFGEEVKRRLMLGAYVLSSGYYDAYYLQAQRLRRLIAADFDRAFEKCDLLAGATTLQTAFAFGEKTTDPVEMYNNDIFTNAVNLAGLPGLSIPVGFDQQNLPIGMQLIAPYLREADLLNAAHQYQNASNWHTQIPQAFQ